MHLDETWTYRALRRIREIEAQSGSIRKRTLSVSCNEDNRIEPSGEGLEKAILAHVAPSLEEYSRTKQNWANKVGYECSTGYMRFELHAENLHGMSLRDYLVDLSLGIKEPLKVGRTEIRDVRFGIPAPAPYLEFSEGEFDIVREPANKVEVTFRVGTSMTCIDMDLFLPQGLGPSLDMSDLKFLLKGKFLNLVFGPQASINFAPPDYEANVPLGDLQDFASFVLITDEAVRLKKWVKMSMRWKLGMLSLGEFKPPQNSIPEAIDLAGVVQNAWVAAKHLDIHKRVGTSIRDLLYQKERLSLFNALFSPDSRKVKVQFCDRQGSFKEESRACVPWGTEIILGEFRGSIVASSWGEVHNIGLNHLGQAKYEIVTSERRLEKTYVGRIDDSTSLRLSDIVHAVADAQAESVTCIILEQYASGR